MRTRRNLMTGILVALITLLALNPLACAAREPTATPVPPVPPAPAAAPAPVATPTVAMAPATPTPALVVPTPTRVLPTPTPAATGKPVYGSILRDTRRMDEKSLDPHYAVTGQSYTPLWAILNGVVQEAPDGSAAPDLARSWDFSPDGRVITFHLQQGVKFHDGTPLNAQAVKWSFDRMLDPNQFSPRRAEFEGELQSVDVVNEETVVMRLKRPFRPFLAMLLDRNSWVVSPTAVQKLGKDFGRKPVGTGPFILTEWVPDQYLTMKRNDSYWEKGKPYLDGIRINILTDLAVMLAMLRTGETDLVEIIRPEDIPAIQANPILKLSPPVAGRTDRLNFNVSMAPFNNKALRQAVAYAMDREKLAKVLFAGAAQPAYTMMGSGWSHNPDLKPIVYDPAKARAKLAEAGYPTGITLPLGCRGASQELFECEVHQAMLKEAGINVEIKAMPAGDYTGPEGFIKKWGLGALRQSPRPDPHFYTFLNFHSRSVYHYRGEYANPEVDRLIDEAAGTYDTAKAKLLYDRVQTIVTEDVVMVWLTHRTEWTAMNRKVQNWQWFVHTNTRVHNLWLEK